MHQRWIILPIYNIGGKTMMKNFGITIVLVVLFLGSTIVIVDGGSTPEIEARLTALEANVTLLKTENTALKNLLAGVSRYENDIYIDKANVHIRDGSGSTDGPVNGLGNLIIGYNEKIGKGDNRTGSHNLVLGSKNNYMSYGGLVAGQRNEISGGYASVSGGWHNKASGTYSSVSGGDYNKASGHGSSVSGGLNNTASSSESSVSGGVSNTARNETSSVSGGWHNTASGISSSVSGGANRNVFGYYDWRAGSYFQDI
jgi:hypothetical protein